MKDNCPTLLELVPVVDQFVTKLAKIERLPGDNIRFVFAVERVENGEVIFETISKLVGPRCEVMESVAQILAFLSEPSEEDRRRRMIC